MKVSGGQIVGISAVAIAGYLSRHDLPPMDWRDYTAFAVLGLLLYWCFKPLRSDSLVDATGHQQTGQSFAFRLGKSLKRVFRR